MVAGDARVVDADVDVGAALFANYAPWEFMTLQSNLLAGSGGDNKGVQFEPVGKKLFPTNPAALAFKHGSAFDVAVAVGLDFALPAAALPHFATALATYEPLLPVPPTVEPKSVLDTGPDPGSGETNHFALPS